MNKTTVILLSILILWLVILVVFYANFFLPVCSRYGSGVIEVDCKCWGWEFRHLREEDPTDKNYETQCLGIIGSRKCTKEGKKVNCNNYDFGFEGVKRK